MTYILCCGKQEILRTIAWADGISGTKVSKQEKNILLLHATHWGRIFFRIILELFLSEANLYDLSYLFSSSTFPTLKVIATMSCWNYLMIFFIFLYINDIHKKIIFKAIWTTLSPPLVRILGPGKSRIK